MTWEIIGTKHLGVKVQDMSKVQCGMTIRVRLSANLGDPPKPHDYEAEGMFIDWVKESGYGRVKLENGSEILVAPNQILGQVITYIEKKVVPF